MAAPSAPKIASVQAYPSEPSPKSRRWMRFPAQSNPADIAISRRKTMNRVTLLRDNLDENGGNRALKRRPVAQA
jgi:hypothetical protein